MLFSRRLELSAVLLLVLAAVLLVDAVVLLVAASDVEAAPGLALLAGALRVEAPSPLLLVDGPFFAPSLQEEREANIHHFGTSRLTLHRRTWHHQ